MTSPERWKEAQSFERAYWEGIAKQIRTTGHGNLSFYEWRASNLLDKVAKAFPSASPSFETGTAVEIGSGAVGTVAYLRAAQRYAYDPLCEFYASMPELIKYRTAGVNYRTVRGESVPHEDNSVDLVVIENCIDHVENAEGVMKEINRILKPGAVLFLTVNLHPTWGAFLHNIVAKLRIDRGHPYTFTLDSIKRFLSDHGFELQYCEWENYKESRSNDLKSSSLKDKLKAIGGLSEFLFTSVSVKR